MKDVFARLGAEKRDRILNAAIEEFACKSYEDASTNQIVAAAGIGKGMLFHYFGSKRELYLDLYQYARKQMDQEVYQRLHYDVSLPQVLKELARRMVETFRLYPAITDFIARCNGETSPEVAEDIARLRKERGTQLKEDILGRVLDLEQLKPNLQRDEARDLIRWALEGCFGSISRAYHGEALDDPAVVKLLERYDMYMDILYEAFYQPDGRVEP